MDTLLVIAKAPVPGRSKTRLCPPCTPEQAAGLAEAALADTLEAVAAAGARRRVLVLEGAPGDWLPAGFDVVPQRAGGLADRLRGGFEDAGTGGFLVGMDTPQVTAGLLDAALAATGRHGSSLGRTGDGGWWGIGLPGPEAARVFDGVPMSSVFTGDFQAAALRRHGHRPAVLPLLRDVDTFTDARVVAAAVPGSRFAAGVAAVRA